MHDQVGLDLDDFPLDHEFLEDYYVTPSSVKRVFKGVSDLYGIGSLNGWG